MTVGLVAWALTTLRYPTEPHKLLPPYLLTAGLLMLHIWEEYAFGFAPRIAGITGSGYFDPHKPKPLVWFAIMGSYHLLGLDIAAVIVTVWT